ncbi:MAG: division/cell wall cluster transcriptional repressor MraZ [Robiginitomaculum sp.]|nr:division/cell wall cluster transcriptional repressor MraZ [Robiginitomaculum sp.]
MFLSCVTNALDAKGRVSVPADFRAVIASDIASGHFDGIIVWPSVDGSCLEGGGIALMRIFQASLDNMDPCDDDRMVFEHAIFAKSRRLAFDGNGRVSLPKDLAMNVGLDKQVTFVGLGRRFEIWNPQDYNAKSEETSAAARESGRSLRLLGRPGVTGRGAQS